MPSTPRSPVLPPNWREWNHLEKQRLLETLRKAKSARQPRDPVGWAASRGIHLWSAQRQIAQSVQDRKRNAVKAGHAVGKSFEAAVLACWWIDTRDDAMVVSTAPSSHQVHGILWEEIRGLHRRLGLPGYVTMTDTWKIGGRLVAFGRKPPDQAKGSDFDPSTFQGYHRRGGVLVILDEAGGLPDWLWTAAETIATEETSRILAIGNPDNPGSHFAAVCAPGREGWGQHTISVFDSPNFTGEQVPLELAAALVPVSWEQEMAREWGREDRRYISKALAEFPSDHPDQIIPAGDLRACRFAEPRAVSELVPVELGVDVGGGKDKTVIRERCGLRAGRRWVKLTGKPEEAGPFLVAIIRETGATSVKIDGTGIGWGLAGEITNAIRRGELPANVQVHAVKTGDPPSNPQAKAKFKNLKAQMWWEIGREGSQRGTWDLSVMEHAEATMTELLMPRWFPDARGLIQVESKDDIRSRSNGASPDDADALLLAFHVPAVSLGGDWLAAVGSGRLRR